MTKRVRATAVCSASLFVLIAGCKAKPKREAAPNPYFIEQRMEGLEGKIDRLSRRFNVLERKIGRLAEHPWFSSVGEGPLASLPEATGRHSSVTARRPPPDLPLPEAKPKRLSEPKSPQPASAPAPSQSGAKKASPISRITRFMRPKLRERSAKELFRLGRRHFEAGELDTAVEKLRLYMERTKDGKRTNEALLLIGRAELARGRPMAAATSLGRLLGSAPDGPERPRAFYHAGEAFHRLNDKVQALKRWKELEARYPSHPLARKARDSILKMAQER